jgi:hypothetical protein
MCCSVGVLAMNAGPLGCEEPPRKAGPEWANALKATECTNPKG